MRFAEASIAECGGHYIVRGARIEVLEGNATDDRLVIVEFPSLSRATEWYNSPAYAQALQYRDKALKRRLIVQRQMPC